MPAALVLANGSSRHHHHHIDDQNSASLHQTGTPTASTPRHHLHHHHHADGTIHFHPHPKSSSSHHKSPRVPLIQINNNPTLEAVCNLPRRHLGSTLYSPELESSSAQASSRSVTGRKTTSYAIPRYEGKENCTLTVRVPRYYLGKEEREHVCLDRAVWGTDIYSDDSDPLAAAIHAGWIRGEWGDGVDFSMLEINSSTDPDIKDSVFTSVPASPLPPVPGKDLHLTLLILPTLQQYTSSVAHGIKSRPWGSEHDGLSYRIEKLSWVDEKASSGQERIGESRHKRLRMSVGSRAAAPLLRLNMGQALGKTMVATAAA